MRCDSPVRVMKRPVLQRTLTHSIDFSNLLYFQMMAAEHGIDKQGKGVQIKRDGPTAASTVSSFEASSWNRNSPIVIACRSVQESTTAIRNFSLSVPTSSSLKALAGASSPALSWPTSNQARWMRSGLVLLEKCFVPTTSLPGRLVRLCKRHLSCH